MQVITPTDLGDGLEVVAGKVVANVGNGLSIVSGAIVAAGGPAVALGAANLILKATGGSDLVFGAGGWAENTYNVMKLNQVTDTLSAYDPVTGIFTVPQDGWYALMAWISLRNLGGVFDGNSGMFEASLLVGNEFVADHCQQIYRGTLSSRGVNRAIYGSVNATLRLKQGDAVSLKLYTDSTAGMGGTPSDVIVRRNDSALYAWLLG